MIIKYVSLGDSIATSKRVDDYCRSILKAKRVPRPVRALFDAERGRGGPVEVIWDTATRSAELVPFYERAGW